MFVLKATIHGSNPVTTPSSTKLTYGRSRAKVQTGRSRAGNPTMHPSRARGQPFPHPRWAKPRTADFLQALEVLVQAQDGEPYRDVYDFCNRFSHGEGSERVDVLDARAIHGQIRRCMEFLRAVDGEHFERMCAATSTNSAVLP